MLSCVSTLGLEAEIQSSNSVAQVEDQGMTSVTITGLITSLCMLLIKAATSERLERCQHRVNCP